MVERSRPAGALALALALGVAGIAGCASDGPQRVAPTTATAPGGPTTLAAPGGSLPPATGAELDAVIEAVLAPQGWTVSRASIVRDHTPARTVVLSIYARPLRPMGDDDYAATLAPLAAGVIPVLMARFDGVGALDLCQVPFEVPADGAEPPPTTRLFIRRPDVPAVAWEGLDLAGLLRAAQTGSAGAHPIIDVFSLPRVRATSTWKQAAAAA